MAPRPHDLKKKVASSHEVVDALSRTDELERLRLVLRATGMSRQSHDAEDLLQEAFILLLGKKRKWYISDNSLPQTVHQVMRSISNSWRKASARRKIREGEYCVCQPVPDFDTVVSQLDLSRFLESVPDQDSRLLDFAQLCVEGSPKRDIQAAMRIDDPTYRRLKRRFERVREAFIERDHRERQP